MITSNKGVRMNTVEKIKWLSENYPILGGKKCSEILKTPYNTIRSYAYKYKLRVNKEVIKNERKSRVHREAKNFLNEKNKKWFLENYPILGGKKCSEFLKIPLNIIYSIAIKLKIRMLSETTSIIHSNNSKKQHFNTRTKKYNRSKTLSIKTPEESYIFGLLWGDGYLRKPKNNKNFAQYYPSISLKREDLENIKKYFSSIGKWHFYYRKRTSRKEQCDAVLCDSCMGFFLYDNGYCDKSTISPKKILERVPEKLQRYWWMGYIDADGCFYTNKKNYCYQFSLAGSYDQDWTEFEKLLGKLNVKYTITKRIQNKNSKNSKSSCVRITNKENIIKLGEYIYGKDMNVGLERKHQKYLEIKFSM